MLPNGAQQQKAHTIGQNSGQQRCNGHDVGDGSEGHGEHFEISDIQDGEISRVGGALLPTQTSRQA
jgi:hypothetical protein